MGNRKRVVILGGGFGGVYTAIELEKALGHDRDVEIILVSRENYLVFQPMLPEVISGSVGLTDVVSPIRRLVKTTQLHMREVERVDLERRVVVANPGFRSQPHEIPYDHLVLALGNVTDFRGMRGLKEHAEAKDIVLEAYEEHNVVDMVMSEIEQTPLEDETWKAKFTVMKENLEHHIEEEEGEMFTKARQALDEEELSEIADMMESRRNELRAVVAA